MSELLFFLQMRVSVWHPQESLHQQNRQGVGCLITRMLVPLHLCLRLLNNSYANGLGRFIANSQTLSLSNLSINNPASFILIEYYCSLRSTQTPLVLAKYSVIIFWECQLLGQSGFVDFCRLPKLHELELWFQPNHQMRCFFPLDLYV